MPDKIFRKKSLDRLSSPEQLSDYLQVTNPAVWTVLVAVILLLAALFVWSVFTSVESYATGSAVVRNGSMTITFDDAETARNVETGMKVTVGEIKTEIISVGTDPDRNIIAAAVVNMPDGEYKVKVGYKYTQIIEMLFKD